MDKHQNYSTVSSDRTSRYTSFKWIGICAVLVALAFVAITVFSVSVNTIVYVALLLACPLMHLWMMKDGTHKH